MHKHISSILNQTNKQKTGFLVRFPRWKEPQGPVDGQLASSWGCPPTAQNSPSLSPSVSQEEACFFLPYGTRDTCRRGSPMSLLICTPTLPTIHTCSTQYTSVLTELLPRQVFECWTMEIFWKYFGVYHPWFFSPSSFKVSVSSNKISDLTFPLTSKFFFFFMFYFNILLGDKFKRYTYKVLLTGLL